MKIDKAYILCLDKREREWIDLIGQCRLHNIKPTPFLVGDGELIEYGPYAYIDDPNPDISNWIYGNPKYKHHHYNAFKSHQVMIEHAKEEGLKRVLFLEDDAYFTKRFDVVIAAIQDFDFDLLYLGWWIGQETDAWNRNGEREFNEDGLVRINKVVRLGGLHAVIINHTMFDTILQFPPIDPIDSQLNKIHHRIKSFFIVPKIVHVKNIYSHCEGGTIERLVL